MRDLPVGSQAAKGVRNQNRAMSDTLGDVITFMDMLHNPSG